MRAVRLNLLPADCKDSIERELDGEPVGPCLVERRERDAPLAGERETWMHIERTRLSRHAPVPHMSSSRHSGVPSSTNRA